MKCGTLNKYRISVQNLYQIRVYNTSSEGNPKVSQIKAICTFVKSVLYKTCGVALASCQFSHFGFWFGCLIQNSNIKWTLMATNSEEMKTILVPDRLKMMIKTGQMVTTVGFQSIEIGNKVFLTYDNVFHVYLIRGLQKFANFFFSRWLFFKSTLSVLRCTWTVR